MVFRIVYAGDLAIIGKILEFKLKSVEEVKQHLRDIQGFQTGQNSVYEFVKDKSD